MRLYGLGSRGQPIAALAHLRLQPGWSPAVDQLRVLHGEHRERVQGATGYADVYAGARAAMVFDVVASHRRKYREIVLPAVQRFRAEWPGITLAGLASGGPFSGLGLPTARWETIVGVAAGLERYRADRPELAISDARERQLSPFFLSCSSL